MLCGDPPSPPDGNTAIRRFVGGRATGTDPAVVRVRRDARVATPAEQPVAAVGRKGPRGGRSIRRPLRVGRRDVASRHCKLPPTIPDAPIDDARRPCCTDALNRCLCRPATVPVEVALDCIFHRNGQEFLLRVLLLLNYDVL